MPDFRNSPDVASSSNLPKQILVGTGAGDAMGPLHGKSYELVE